MKKQEMRVMEDFTESMLLTDHIPSSYTLSGMFDEKSSLGFMELLGVQDFCPTSTTTSLFDNMPPQVVQTTSAPSNNADLKLTPKVEDSSEVLLNLPATPNSSSISFASSEGHNEEQGKAVDEEEEQPQKTKKQLKPKKTNKKKQREPRFAFMTKSEVDHLEDGYRWRKYGQKAVKNSPFPRSYYRCTTVTCDVKKRVERSCSDPTIVVTTYEGQHTHTSPIMPRGNPAGFLSDSTISAGGATAFGVPIHMTLSHFHHLHQQQLQPIVHNNFSPLSFGYVSSSTSPHERRFCTAPIPMSGLLRDHGLLQDIVPSLMPKEE